MSIAGIAKEVTTIAASAIVFGDELTPLNVTGVGITVAGEFFSPHGTLFLMERLIRAVPLGICLYTYHKYRKSIDSQVPLDLDGNPISDEDPDGGGVALDLGYIHENAPFNAEEARPQGLSASLSSDGQRAHNAVRTPFSDAWHYIKLNPRSMQAPRDQAGDNPVLFALDDEEDGGDPESRERRTH